VTENERHGQQEREDKTESERLGGGGREKEKGRERGRGERERGRKRGREFTDCNNVHMRMKVTSITCNSPGLGCLNVKQGSGSQRVAAFCSLTTNGVSYGVTGPGCYSKRNNIQCTRLYPFWFGFTIQI
jgi:hypothetical protein